MSKIELLKSIVKWSLCLIALCLLSPIVLKILGLIFSVNFGNIIWTGIKVGLVAWIMLIVYSLYSKSKIKNK